MPVSPVSGGDAAVAAGAVVAAGAAEAPARGSGARAARRARRRKRSSGSRLFRYDRALGVRFVAGADEAGRGCLAGPLVAAAVLFDHEKLTLSDLRSLSALNDSKQHTIEAREELYPRILRAATAVAVTSRCVRGIDERGLHKTNLAALSDMLRRVGVEGCLCLSDGFPVPPTGFDQRPVVGRRRDERGDRGGLGGGEGHARPVHGADGGALPGLGVRGARRLLDAGAPGGDRAARGLAAAPHELRVDRVPAARALAAAACARRATRVAVNATRPSPGGFVLR